VEPAESEPTQETAAPVSRRERTQRWAALIRADAERLAARAEAERGRHRSVDAVFEMADRDGEVGGGIIAGALAYRLFIWLLPLALVAVAGLGIAADASSESPDEAARTLGLEGLVSNSIANAADSRNRWYALLIGIPVLIWATRSVLRVLIGAHRLIWGDARSAAPRPKLVPTLLLLGVFLSFGVVSAAASAVRAWSTGPGVLATVLSLVFYAGLWLLVSVRLPHRGTGWTALIPGALVFGLGLEVLHVVVAYFITPYAIAKEGTYGALGVAAALLVGLFLVSRLIVAAAVVNATLWQRQAQPA
jgi:membrane protein